MTLLLDASLSKRDLSSASIRPLADKLVAYYADKLAFLNEAMYDYVFIPFAVLLWEALVYVHTRHMRCHRRTVLGMAAADMWLRLPRAWWRPGWSCGTACSLATNTATRLCEVWRTCVA